MQHLMRLGFLYLERFISIPPPLPTWCSQPGPTKHVCDSALLRQRTLCCTGVLRLQRRSSRHAHCCQPTALLRC